MCQPGLGGRVRRVVNGLAERREASSPNHCPTVLNLRSLATSYQARRVDSSGEDGILDAHVSAHRTDVARLALAETLADELRARSWLDDGRPRTRSGVSRQTACRALRTLWRSRSTSADDVAWRRCSGRSRQGERTTGNPSSTRSSPLGRASSEKAWRSGGGRPFTSPIVREEEPTLND